MKKLISILTFISVTANAQNLKLNPQEFSDFLFAQNLEKTALLLMSSGNYGGLDFEKLCGTIS